MQPTDGGAEFDWSQHDRYIDSGGKLIARILCVADGKVWMERWPKGGTKCTRFDLPIEFFRSPRCGWQLTRTPGATT
jgi:hypothetical protein